MARREELGTNSEELESLRSVARCRILDPTTSRGVFWKIPVTQRI
jgi:hypothetical protein